MREGEELGGKAEEEEEYGFLSGERDDEVWLRRDNAEEELELSFVELDFDAFEVELDLELEFELELELELEFEEFEFEIEFELDAFECNANSSGNNLRFHAAGQWRNRNGATDCL